jgi:glycerol-3-phosphate dehydrogenase
VSTSVDVAVIGAGIHGAGVAQAAAAAGHSVLLIEQSAIAAGTSSRSSKLIHGGLRYLETGQFHLVRDSLHERRLLLRLAPDLVHLRRFYVPIYRRTRRRPWQLRLGLSLYALLAGCGRGSGFGTVPRKDWDRLDGLDTNALQTVFYYHDAQTDDAALTRAVVRSAQALGAQLLCPARFTGANLRADGVELRYATGAPHDGATLAAETRAAQDLSAHPQGAAVPSGGERECHARVLINATGAWADHLARRLVPEVPVPRVERVQGSHLILPLTLERGCYYLESPRDGRAIFALPWHGRLLLGTTETRYRGDPARVAPTLSEIHYLLGVLKRYFPRWRELAAEDIVDSFAGLRVLPTGSGHAFHRSRETLLITDRRRNPRVLSIYGGKLTTWRSVAQRVLTRVAPSLPPRSARARTDQLPLQPDGRGD